MSQQEWCNEQTNMLYSSFKMVLKMLSKQKQMEVCPILTMPKLR